MTFQELENSPDLAIQTFKEKKKNEQATSGNKRGEEGEAHHFGNELSK